VIRSVTAFTRSYDHWYDRYQRYYREGLRRESARRDIQYREVAMTRATRALRPVRRWRDRYLSRLPGEKVVAGVDAAARALEGPVRTPSGVFHDGVGQYLIATDDGRECRVCIDAVDYPTLPSDQLVAWSDLYFKSNRWPSQVYPGKVLPLVNGDPLILGRIESLRRSRSTPKEWDLCFVVRVWGGRDVVEGIEHNVRLLESLNRIDGSKVLIAYLVAGDIAGISRRLDAARIPHRRRSVRPNELWRLMARSRLNVIRLGMHYCIPWRMAGAVALGSCVVLDQAPLPSWPVPLREDVNFFDLGATTVDSPLSDPGNYEAIPEKVAAWLAEPERIRQMQSENAEYFDRFVDPACVGAYILDAVRDHRSEPV
jgi:hypothetical protein